jgi:hypothetical protein
MRMFDFLRVRIGAGLGLALISAACATTPAPTEQLPLADIQAIEATLERYTRGRDRLDPDLYVSSFAPDGRIVIGADSFEGHDALRAIIEDEAELRLAEPRTLFHLETNPRLEMLAPDHVLHHAYWLTITRADDGALGVLDVGSQVDELRKVDDEWLIVRREIGFDP